MKIHRIACEANPADPACVGAAAELKRRLVETGFEIVDLSGGSLPTADVLVVLGGDGFLMESLHRLDYPPIPVFGVNFGTVGSHMNPQHCLSDVPELLEAGQFLSERCPVLRFDATLETGETLTGRAFNDIVLERRSRQAIRFSVSIDGVLFNRFAGDGFVIATPVGSTAYNLAAGGPVVHPRVEAMVVTPLYPHRAAPFHSVQFSVMVPIDSSILVVADDLPKRGMRLVADGLPLERTASVEIASAATHVNLLRTTDRDFIRTLSQKFT